jgi:hypothetical protein
VFLEVAIGSEDVDNFTKTRRSIRAAQQYQARCQLSRIGWAAVEYGFQLFAQRARVPLPVHNTQGQLSRIID